MNETEKIVIDVKSDDSDVDISDLFNAFLMAVLDFSNKSEKQNSSF